MNVDFREFMLGATVRDRQYGQNLLFQTQKLFAFMQESVRPFINPEECVASIKTYEDTQIDIVIQMDVDEFYNLLFDRWEGQFLTSDEKNCFREFYGGQLVQQVRSQECEHVSERLEPFSAIQCDIKGKTSLEESLQAYVDGEIMDGGMYCVVWGSGDGRRLLWRLTAYRQQVQVFHLRPPRRCRQKVCRDCSP